MARRVRPSRVVRWKTVLRPVASKGAAAQAARGREPAPQACGGGPDAGGAGAAGGAVKKNGEARGPARGGHVFPGGVRRQPAAGLRHGHPASLDLCLPVPGDRTNRSPAAAAGVRPRLARGVPAQRGSDAGRRSTPPSRSPRGSPPVTSTEIESARPCSATGLARRRTSSRTALSRESQERAGSGLPAGAGGRLAAPRSRHPPG